MVQILRRLRHLWSATVQASVESGSGWEATTSGTARSEKDWSWVWKICLAVSGEEMMIVFMKPRRRVMSGP